METVIRVVIIYFVIVAGLRVLGKREFGQLSPLELVTLLLIPEIVAQALVREDYSLTNAIIGVTTLFSVVFITSTVTHFFRPFEKVISGEPTLLAHEGRFIAANMNRERISPEEVYSELHKAGLVDIAETRWVILEPDGKIAVIGREKQETPHAPNQEKFLS